MLQTVELNPTTEIKASIIWLHGLGADGHDFTGIIPELDIQNQLGIRFVFPHAPMQAITINNGHVMRAWYDIGNPDLTQEQDGKGIKQSENGLLTLINNEIEQGIAANRIILAGFSQGGAIALYAGLRYQDKLGGIIALSTYLPLADKFKQTPPNQDRNTPIMLCHGTHDNIVPIGKGENSRNTLAALGYQPQWHDYDMEHSVCIEEIKDIAAWITHALSQP